MQLLLKYMIFMQNLRVLILEEDKYLKIFNDMEKATCLSHPLRTKRTTERLY